MKIEPAKAEVGLLRHPTLPYVLPFVAFLSFLALDRYLPFSTDWNYAFRFTVVLALLLVFSRGVIPWDFASFWGSAALGVALFAIWVGPDVLWPAYRQSWLFTNALVGAPTSSLPPEVKHSVTFIVFRALASVVNVPI